MARKVNLLVDTDIFIDYLNHRQFLDLFESDHFTIFYSVVTKRELLSKGGLQRSEQQAIHQLLKSLRIIFPDQKILDQYSELRIKYPTLGKGDCMIAATAITKKLSLVTRNYKHFRPIKDLLLYFSAR